MPIENERVGVVGLGYVGLPVALAFTEAGYDVVGVDVDDEKVSSLSNGTSYVRDISDKAVATSIDSGFEPVTEYERLSTSDGVIICVPTPLDSTGDPDVSHVVDTVSRLSDVLPDSSVVVLESTVYPGATEEIVARQLSSNGWTIGEDVNVAFSPERIDPGNENYPITEIPKVVGGVTSSCGDAAEALYSPVFEDIVRVSSSTEAEFVKILENTYRSVNIGLINELAMAADRLKVDIWEIIDAAETKPFGFMPFYPGPGLGGHCIPVDPMHLSWKADQSGLETRFIDIADRVNRKMPEYVVNRVSTFLNTDGVALLDADILVLGVSYKPDVPDTRLSPAYDIIDQLRAKGASVEYHDPHVSTLETDDWEYRSQELSEDCLKSQECVLIVTDHSVIDFEYVADHAPRVFDTRNALQSSEEDHIETI
jgi:UDP-N-acetyl-D-glucosamine dehydrogenase